MIYKDEELTHEDRLMHYGIMGMKWGHKNGPPYPLSAGDHSASEKKAGWRQSLKSSRAEKKLKKKKAKALEKARIARQKKAAEKKAREEFLKNKDTVLARGRAGDVLKYQGELSNQELKTAVDRIKLERELSSFAADEKDIFRKKVNKVVRWGDTAASGYNAFKSLYNSYAEVHNSLYPDEPEITKLGETRKSKSAKRKDQLDIALKELALDNAMYNKKVHDAALKEMEKKKKK